MKDCGSNIFTHYVLKRFVENWQHRVKSRCSERSHLFQSLLHFLGSKLTGKCLIHLCYHYWLDAIENIIKANGFEVVTYPENIFPPNFPTDLPPPPKHQFHYSNPEYNSSCCDHLLSAKYFGTFASTYTLLLT